MTESAQETMARVDKILARLQAAKDCENAQGAIAGSQNKAKAQKQAQRAAARSACASGIIERLDREAEERRKTFVPPNYSWGPSFLDISCGRCGYQGDAAEFFTDALGFDRPRGEIQCPKCKWAVRREWRDGDIRLTPTHPTL